MAKKKVSHVQFGLSCIQRLEQQELPQIHFPCLVIVLLFATNLLDICHSENVSGGMSDSPVNSTTEDKLILMTTASNIRQKSDISQNEKTENQNKQLDTKQSTDTLKNKQRLTNDIIKRFGLNSTNYNKSSEQDVYLSDITSHVENETGLESTTESETYSRRPIYIRGHLLEHLPSGKKTFHPPDTPEGYFRTNNNSIHLHRVLNFPKDSDSQNTSNRQKRKHIPNKERFHNYKMLYDSINGNEDDKTKRTEFYAWMFGAAMLVLGSLTTVTTCIVFCFCGNKNQQTQNTGVQPRNTPSRHSGEYQRVESVSSIVDHAGDYTDSLYEEHRHSVTII